MTAKDRRRTGRILLASALAVIVSIAVLAMAGCAGADVDEDADVAGDDRAASEDIAGDDDSGGNGDASSDASSSETSAAEDYADELMDGMTVEEKAAQLFILTPEQLTGFDVVVQAGDTTKDALEEYPVGGLVYFDENLEDADQTGEMLGNTQSYARYGLFLGVDEEGGSLVARIANNDGFSVEQVPDMKEIGESGDVDEARRAGAVIGEYLSGLGFNMDFAPVADVLTNPGNTAIGVRSFGSDSQIDADMVAQVVQGLQENQIVSVLKHFPGHGDTDEDSHDGAAVSNRTLDELESTEFLPFEAGIEAGASCVMVGHISLPQVTDDDLPATLSPEIVTDLLRGQLGFDGVVITDSMSMGAITNYYSPGEAAVMAVNAGCDMLLKPENFQEAYQGIVDALDDGSLTQERLDESVRRILLCKIEHGVIDLPEQ